MRAVWILLVLAFVAGIAVPVQFAANSELRGATGGPVTAAAISFVIGTAALLLVVLGLLLAARGESPAVPAPAGVPWWAWTGGLLGGFYVTASIVLTPRLGAAATLGFVIAGQMVASVVLDHFGLLNLPEQSATLVKLVGVALVIAGAVVVLRSR